MIEADINIARCWFVSVPQLKPQCWVQKEAYAAVSLNLNILSYIQVHCYPLRWQWQLHSDLGDLNNGVYYVMGITTAQSDPLSWLTGLSVN